MISILDIERAFRLACLRCGGKLGVGVHACLDDYEKTAEELRFIKAVARGLADIREGNTVTLAEAKKMLGADE